MISVVVPIHNEEESLIALHGELDAGFYGGTGPVEFIFVDDGSRDGSWGVLVALAERDTRVRRDPVSAELWQGGGSYGRIWIRAGRFDIHTRRRSPG